MFLTCVNKIVDIPYSRYAVSLILLSGDSALAKLRIPRCEKSIRKKVFHMAKCYRPLFTLVYYGQGSHGREPKLIKMKTRERQNEMAIYLVLTILPPHEVSALLLKLNLFSFSFVFPCYLLLLQN